MAEIEAGGGTALFTHADMGITADCKRAVDEAVAAFGGLDIVFNNVGIQPPDSYVNAVELDEVALGPHHRRELKSRFLMAKFAVPHMRDRGGGVIIHSASVQGLQSMPGAAGYAASKGGDLSLVRQLAIDFAADNIRVLAVCPGTIDTPLVRNATRRSGRRIDEALLDYGPGAPARTRRPARGGGRGGAVPGQRPRLVHDRRTRLHRWWNHGVGQLGFRSRSARLARSP